MAARQLRLLVLGARHQVAEDGVKVRNARFLVGDGPVAPNATRRPSDHSRTCRASSGVQPERKVCSSWRAPSMVVITAYRAPVSVRAASAISCSTVSTSRLALTRRMAAERAAMRSRSASISRLGSLFALKCFPFPLWNPGPFSLSAARADVPKDVPEDLPALREAGISREEYHNWAYRYTKLILRMIGYNAVV